MLKSTNLRLGIIAGSHIGIRVVKRRCRASVVGHDEPGVVEN